MASHAQLSNMVMTHEETESGSFCAAPAIPVTGSNVSLQVTGANRFNFRDGYQQPYIGVLAKV